MKNFLVALLVFLVWSFFALWLYSWLDPGLELAGNSKITNDSGVDSLEGRSLPVDSLYINQSDSIVTVDGFTVPRNNLQGLHAVNQDGDIIFLFNQGISIAKNSSVCEIPESVIDFKYKLNTYLIEHPDQELHILSRYSADENIESPNLGIQRAEYIIGILVETGIPREKIVVKSLINELSFGSDDTYGNGISFLFRTLNEDRMEAAKTEVMFPRTKVVYPRFSTQGILVNDALLTLLEETKEMIVLYPDINIKVIGHTDNVGNSTDNYTEGLTYARQVRWYLVSKGGVDRKNIIALSEGESQAIASNKTRQGRELNRRIEIVFDQ